jgi:hypothetical protein
MIVEFMYLGTAVTTAYCVGTIALPADIVLGLLLPGAKGLGATADSLAAFRMVIAGGFLGCANGQYHAAKEGPVACKNYCKYLLVPMALFTAGSFQGGGWDLPIQAGFTLAIGYFGYMS